MIPYRFHKCQHSENLSHPFKLRRQELRETLHTTVSPSATHNNITYDKPILFGTRSIAMTTTLPPSYFSRHCHKLLSACTLSPLHVVFPDSCLLDSSRRRILPHSSPASRCFRNLISLIPLVVDVSSLIARYQSDILTVRLGHSQNVVWEYSWCNWFVSIVDLR